MTLESFHPRDYEGKRIVFRCRTLDSAIHFLKILHSYGYEWFYATPLTYKTNWRSDMTCYRINTTTVTYSDASWYERHGYEIIDWDLVGGQLSTKLSNDEWENILSSAKGGDE